jgi:major vault protein
MAENGRERGDLVLNPGEFAFVQDRSKGNISVNVGPHKASMSDTEQTVTWDDRARRFIPCGQDRAVQAFLSAPEGHYIVLHNPAVGDRPTAGKSSNAVDLSSGTRVHRNGPAYFPLWPGEVAEVVKGHDLRSNQYLLARVYNEAAATEHLGEAVVKPQILGDAKAPEAQADAADQQEQAGHLSALGGPLVTGQILVIRGNEISFFIPPTGIEVLRADNGEYVRNAVTLERLEYCILLDEDGNKTYERGPQVVFPSPTQRFVEQAGALKFGAVELNRNSGIYVKVIEDYDDPDGGELAAGDELFITGASQPIYFPRQEHAVIRYGESEIHYAVAVPKGEGRYVLDRRSGQVNLVVGPTMLLPDPRHEVIVQRVIDPKTVDLWYPGNAVARMHNERLQRVQQEAGGYLTRDAFLGEFTEAMGGLAAAAAPPPTVQVRSAAPALVGDSMKRGTSFTPPRTVTLNSKYDGAVAVSPWTGYAVQVVSKDGTRRVVHGPTTVLLQYDESLTVLELSSGTPKSDQQLKRTVYLRAKNNKVSDLVTVETKDQCRVDIRLSYRVNFEGQDPDAWFANENYVRLLTEHCGSLIRNAARRQGIEEFYGNAISVVRDTVLGAVGDGGGATRRGRLFEENGMRVYDVEVLDVTIKNAQIAGLLVNAQHTAVEETLKIAQAEARLGRTLRAEALTREEAQAKDQTSGILAEIERTRIERGSGLDMLREQAQAAVEGTRRQYERDLQTLLDAIADAEMARESRRAATESADYARRLDLETTAHERAMKALTPSLVETLTRFADEKLMERLTDSLAPIALLSNRSVSDVLGRYVDGTPFAAVLDSFKARVHHAADGEPPKVGALVPR